MHLGGHGAERAVIQVAEGGRADHVARGAQDGAAAAAQRRESVWYAHPTPIGSTAQRRDQRLYSVLLLFCITVGGPHLAYRAHPHPRTSWSQQSDQRAILEVVATVYR